MAAPTFTPSIDQVLQTKHDEDGYAYREVWDPQRPLALNITAHNYQLFPVLDPEFEFEAGTFSHGDAHTFLYNPGSTDAADFLSYWQSAGYWIVALGDIFASGCVAKSCKITLYATRDRRQALDIATSSKRIYVLFHPFDTGPALPNRPKPPTGGGPLGWPWYITPTQGYDQMGNPLPFMLGLPAAGYQAILQSLAKIGWRF